VYPIADLLWSPGCIDQRRILIGTSYGRRDDKKLEVEETPAFLSGRRKLRGIQGVVKVDHEAKKSSLENP